MHPHTEFKASEAFALAIIGEPFTRKTSIAFQFPRPLIFDCDRKLSSVVNHYPSARPFWYVEPDLDAGGKELPAGAKWPNFIAQLGDCARPEISTIVVDSMSRVADWLRDWIVQQPASLKPITIGGEPYMNQSMWWPFADRIQRLVVTVRAYGKPCIFTFHEKTDKDELTGMVGKRPAIPGQTGDTVAKLFTEVWRTYIRTVGVDAKHPGGVAYMIRTEPMPMMQQLGHTQPLPPEFEFEWSIIANAYPAFAAKSV